MTQPHPMRTLALAIVAAAAAIAAAASKHHVTDHVSTAPPALVIPADPPAAMPDPAAMTTGDTPADGQALDHGANW